MTHFLKIWPQYFCRVKDGSKTFEVRNNDRGFQPGDTVILNQWCPERAEFIGGQLTFKIGYVFTLDAERVVFSLLPRPQPPVTGEEREE